MLVARAWPESDAIAYVLLVANREPIANALRQRDARFAASTYKLCDILFSQHRGSAAQLPPPLYRHLRSCSHGGGLLDEECLWAQLETRDSTNFRGLTSRALVRAYNGAQYFSVDGFSYAVYDKDDQLQYVPQDSDVVRFESAADNEHGAHTAIMINDETGEGVFPPNTLFRLKEVYAPGTWSAPGGCFPNQRLLVVSATYQPRVAAAQPGRDANCKLCAASITLSYGDRDSFLRGLDDLIAQPTLTMKLECERDFPPWLDRRGQAYRMRDEWEYVLGPAVYKQGCTAGVRDERHDGWTPEAFRDSVNELVRGLRGPDANYAEQDACLTMDEALAVRLYSGPAFQPINTFLRQLASLSGSHRRHMATHPALTFAATVGHLCRAIRKLSAVTQLEEGASLWRGVRGELPRTFWVPDAQGMVCAVDSAFMSTSRSRLVPIEYMHSGPNVLWELRPQPESDTGFHLGADISILSQFEGEQEVLYPPCTMLRVRSSAAGDGSDQFDTRDEADGSKDWIKIGVLPTFL